jgi:hypothetical protein
MEVGGLIAQADTLKASNAVAIIRTINNSPRRTMLDESPDCELSLSGIDRYGRRIASFWVVRNHS